MRVKIEIREEQVILGLKRGMIKETKRKKNIGQVIVGAVVLIDIVEEAKVEKIIEREKLIEVIVMIEFLIGLEIGVDHLIDQLGTNTEVNPETEEEVDLGTGREENIEKGVKKVVGLIDIAVGLGVERESVGGIEILVKKVGLVEVVEGGLTVVVDQKAKDILTKKIGIILDLVQGPIQITESPKNTEGGLHGGVEIEVRLYPSRKLVGDHLDLFHSMAS